MRLDTDNEGDVVARKVDRISWLRAEDFDPAVGRTVTSSPDDVVSSSRSSWMGTSEYSRRLVLRSPLVVRFNRLVWLIRLHVVVDSCVDWFSDNSFITTDVGQTTGLLLLDSG